MHVLACVTGVTLVLGMLWDAFETLVLPRTPGRTLRFTRLLSRANWRAWTACARRIRSNSQRESFLGVYGPLSVFALLSMWGAGLVVGFALLQWSQREALLNVHGTPHFFDDLYMSATTFFALGLADVAPEERVGRLLVVAEIGSSLVLMSMLFSYIPIVYQSFARREVRVTMLDAWAGSPPTATGILTRLARSGDVARLETFFADWEQWCADLLESHLSYPAVAYFRSLHPHQSWVAALAAILDVSALVKVGIDGVAGALDVRYRAPCGDGSRAGAGRFEATPRGPSAAGRARPRPRRSRTSGSSSESLAGGGPAAQRAPHIVRAVHRCVVPAIDDAVPCLARHGRGARQLTDESAARRRPALKTGDPGRRA